MKHSALILFGCTAIMLLNGVKTTYSQPASAGPDFFQPSTGGSSLVTVIGYKTQSKAPLIDESGRMLLQANGITVGNFALIDQKTGRLSWSYDEGYYPSSISEFDIPNFKVKLKFFCYKRPITTIGQYNGDFVLVYARAMLTYSGTKTSGTVSVTVGPPSQLTPINAAALAAGTNAVTYDVASNAPIVLDYATATERVSGTGGNTLQPSEIQQIAGNLETVEAEFKAFWKTELDRLVKLVIPSSVPNAAHLSNAQKVAFVHMQVIRVGNEIHIGKNGYDQVFDHDADGILSSAMEMGGLGENDAEALLRNLPAQRQGWDYIDALGKIVWAHAKFCQKFAPGSARLQDLVFTQTHVGADGSNRSVSSWIHYMIDNKLQSDGLAVKSSTLDSDNRSTVDNCAVLLGLKAYAYLCNKAGNSSEYTWAQNQYNKTNAALQDKLVALVSSKSTNQKYVSAGIDDLTENMTNFTFGNTKSAFANANAYSHFFFGRMYELSLLGGSYDKLVPFIDNTLDVGLSRVSDDSRFIVNGQWTGNFGVYDNSHYSNGYNSAYCEGLFLGNGKYRDAFFKSFDFMMGCQTGPYNWFEGVRAPYDYGVTIQGVTKGALVGTGSSPHVWSAMSQARMMTMTFISEKYDGSLILARGIPMDWFDKGEVGVKNYKLSDTTRFSYSIKQTPNAKEYELTFTGKPLGPTVLNCLMFTQKTPRIVSFSGAPANYAEKVTLKDCDGDGKKEIAIDTGYSAAKVVFSMTDATSTIRTGAEITPVGASAIVFHPDSRMLIVSSASSFTNTIIIVNLNGKKVVAFKEAPQTTTINLQPYAKGVYFISIATHKGAVTRKILLP